MPSNNTRKQRLERQCAHCGATFWPFHDRSTFCSRPCFYAAMRATVGRVCESCGMSFQAKPSEVAQGKARYCTRVCADTAKRTDPVARFWSYVEKGGTCWTWTGARDKDGYGVFWDGSRVRAHQYSWRLHVGAIPDGHGVLHRCDNPPCVRPDHLFTGTTPENMRDKVSKARQACGERVGRAKLTADDVVAIRDRYAAGATLKALGREYGVHFGTIWGICQRKTWKHL